jgi:hypothetical protein
MLIELSWRFTDIRLYPALTVFRIVAVPTTINRGFIPDIDVFTSTYYFQTGGGVLTYVQKTLPILVLCSGVLVNESETVQTGYYFYIVYTFSLNMQLL